MARIWAQHPLGPPRAPCYTPALDRRPGAAFCAHPEVLMKADDPAFFTRVWLAFALFFRVMFNAVFAGRVLQLSSGEPAPVPVPQPAAPEPPKLREAPTDAALQLLGLLQREGRLIDFLQEDMGAYTDAQVGAAARVVHDQCRRALDAHLKLERIRSEVEGSRVSVPSGFSPSATRLLGNVVGEPPFQGSLAHAGWRAVHIELPKLSEGHDVNVLAPAEVEL
jgi:hypothetical protein